MSSVDATWAAIAALLAAVLLAVIHSLDRDKFRLSLPDPIRNVIGVSVILLGCWLYAFQTGQYEVGIVPTVISVAGGGVVILLHLSTLIPLAISAFRHVDLLEKKMEGGPNT